MALRSENDQLKAKVKELEARANGGSAEVKKADSLFGSLFGSKPTSAPTHESGDAKKYHDEAVKLKTDMEALKTEHASKIKALNDEKHVLQSKLDASEKSHAEKDSTMSNMTLKQVAIANKLADAEAQLQTTKSQMEAFKIELSSRTPPSQEEMDVAIAPLKEEKAALNAALEESKKSFEEFRVQAQQELESQRRASQDTYALLEKQMEELRGEKATLVTKMAEQRDSLLAEMASASDKDNTEFVSLRKQLDEALAAKEEVQSNSSQELMRLQASTQLKLDQLEQEKRALGEELEKKVAAASSAAASDKSASDAAIEKSTFELAEKALQLQELEAAVASERVAWAQEKDALTKAREMAESEKTALEVEAKSRWESANAALLEAEQAKTALAEQLDKVTKEKAAKAKKSKALQTKLEKAEEAKKQAQDELVVAKEQMVQHGEQLGKVESELASANEANISLSQDRDAILMRLTEIKKNADHTNERLAAVENERDELHKYQELYENQSVALATAQSLVDSLRDQIKALEASAHLAVTREAEKQIEWDTTKSKLEADLAVLRQQVDNFRDEVPMLEMRYTSMKEQYERERTRLKELEIEHGNEKDKTIQLTAAKKELTEKLELTTRKLTEELEHHKSRAQLEAQDLQQKLDEKSNLLLSAQETLATTSAAHETLKTSHATIEQAFESFKSQTTEKSAEYETAASEAETRIKDLEQQVLDREMAAKIAEKQNLMTIQQLKTQLKTLESAPAPARGHQKTASAGLVSSSSASNVSRAKASGSQTGQSPTPKRDLMSSTSALSSSGTPSKLSSSANVSASASSSGTGANGSAGNVSTSGSSHAEPRLPSASSNASDHLGTDIEALSKRIGELTQQNFTLNEQVKLAEEARRKAEKDSRLKSQWIRQNSPKIKGLDTPSGQAPSTATAPSTPQASASTPNAKKMVNQEGTPKRVPPPQETGFFSSFFSSTPTRTPSEDQIQKRQAMGEMLEETLLQKMQLEDEIKLITSDLDTLQRQNRLLMETLVTNSIDIPMLDSKK